MRETRYEGPLTVEAAAEGIRRAHANAEALLEEADILEMAGKYARATALAVLAVQENDKVPLIRQILVEDDPGKRRELWLAYRRHSTKTFLLLVLDSAQRGTVIDDYGGRATAHEDMSAVDSIRRLGVFTDCLGSGGWISPDDVVDKDLCTSVMSMANRVVREMDRPFETTSELELWVRHLRPVWGGGVDAIRRAMAACYRDAAAAGVLRARTRPEGVDRFLGVSPG